LDVQPQNQRLPWGTGKQGQGQTQGRWDGAEKREGNGRRCGGNFGESEGNFTPESRQRGRSGIQDFRV
jgi:hypothetical protein